MEKIKNKIDKVSFVDELKNQNQITKMREFCISLEEKVEIDMEVNQLML